MGTADTFVMGVSMFGCGGYQGSQEIGCQCVPKAEADSANLRSLQLFYARYNESKTPEEIRVALDRNKGKEGKMWNALYKKYPEAIEIISRNGEAQTSTGRGSEL